jgi:hypothetical protein
MNSKNLLGILSKEMSASPNVKAASKAPPKPYLPPSDFGLVAGADYFSFPSPTPKVQAFVHRNGCGELVLNRPSALNALDYEMVYALTCILGAWRYAQQRAWLYSVHSMTRDHDDDLDACLPWGPVTVRRIFGCFISTVHPADLTDLDITNTLLAYFL